MIPRIQALLIAGMTLLLTVLVLIVFTQQRERDFNERQDLSQQALVRGAAHAITIHLLERKKNIRLFTDEYRQLFSRLLSYPSDENVRASIDLRLKERFSDYQEFTITNRNAQPLVATEMGVICQDDVSGFSRELKRSGARNKAANQIFIHPQPGNFHFDIMSPLGLEAGSGRVFFVSFRTDEIVEILKTHEIPGTQLMLVRNDDFSLIEVASEGARDEIVRDARLTEQEIAYIKTFEEIAGTKWRLVDIPDIEYQERFRKNLWKEAGMIVLIFLLASFMMVLLVYKRTNNMRE